MCYFEQILEATPHKTAVVWLLTSHFKNYPSKMNKTCRTLLEKQGQTHDVLLWTHGHINVGWPGRTYLHQLCANTWYSLKRPAVSDGWWRWVKRERESRKSMLSPRIDDDNYFNMSHKPDMTLNWCKHY